MIKNFFKYLCVIAIPIILSLSLVQATVDLDSDSDGYLDMSYMPLDELWTFQAGVTVSSGQALTIPEGALTNSSIVSADIKDDEVKDEDIDWLDVTLIDFTEQNAWRLFYSDGSGDVTELSFGTSGQYLKSQGASSIPTWDNPSASDIEDDAYGAGWNGDTTHAASQNALYDFLVTLDVGSDGDVDSFDATALAAAETDPNVDTESKIEAITGALFGITKTPTSGNIWVADGTDFESVAMSGDATIASGGAITIANNSVDGTDIALGSDAEGDVMYYNGTDWIRLAKGTAGQVLEMNAGATAPEWDTDDDTGQDTTLIDATTWSDGANASNIWTFDVSGTDHTMTAGNGLMTFGDAVTVTDTLTANGGLTVATTTAFMLGANQIDNGSDLLDGEQIAADTIDDDSIDFGDVTSTDLTFDADTVATTAVYSGTTSLEETTAANDSGAYVIGTFDEFDNSNGANVQDVLDDLDAAIAAAGGGDITAVGPGYATGGAFTDGVASTGTTMFTWEGTTVDNVEYIINSPTADPLTADVTITLPAATGTLLNSDGVGTSLTALNGENIQDDTIDDDSIDWTDVTLADFTEQTAWRLFYSNTDGDVTELALGADATFLESNGAAAAPAFRALLYSDITAFTEANLYTILSDVTDFVQPTECPLDSDFGSNGLMKRTAAGAYAVAQAGTDYEAALTDEASLYATLSDVTQFYEAGDEATILDVAGSITDGSTYTNFGAVSDDTVDEMFAAIDAVIAAIDEAAIEEDIFDSDAETITGSWEVQDDVHFSFGNDDDSSFAWDAASARLELRNVSDTPVFWFDLANSSFGVAAVAAPESGLYDSDAAGAARADEYAAGYGANFTDTTEDAEISDMTFHAMVSGTKVTWGDWDGSDESFVLGDSGTGEDLKFDMDTGTANEVKISSDSGVTEIDFTAINLITTGTIQGANNIITDADGISLTAAQMNSVLIMTGAGEVTLPDVCDSATGAWIFVMARDASEQVEMVVTDSADLWVLANGTNTTANDEADLATSASSYAVFACLEANKWYVLGERGTVTDGGVPD